MSLAITFVNQDNIFEIYGAHRLHEWFMDKLHFEDLEEVSIDFNFGLLKDLETNIDGLLKSEGFDQETVEYYKEMFLNFLGKIDREEDIIYNSKF